MRTSEQIEIKMKEVNIAHDEIMAMYNMGKIDYDVGERIMSDLYCQYRDLEQELKEIILSSLIREIDRKGKICNVIRDIKKTFTFLLSNSCDIHLGCATRFQGDNSVYATIKYKTDVIAVYVFKLNLLKNNYYEIENIYTMKN